MENVIDAEYMHTGRVCKEFEIKYLGEYHNFYLKSDKELLADAFEKCLKIYHLDPVKYFHKIL